MSVARTAQKLACLAIRLHHDYKVFTDPKVPDTITRLIAMGLIAEKAIQSFAGMNDSNEWTKGGDYAAGALLLGDHCISDWIERLQADFALGAA